MSSYITISPEQLSEAVSEQLELYQKETVQKIDKAGSKAMKNLVRITKDTAPFNAKHHGRHYVSCIASRKESSRTGVCTYTWYVKPPCHRLTHLLVKGHATKDGGRTKKGLFLENACDKVLPEFEQDVIKAVKDDGN